jgi:hypothetical protein
MFLINFFIGNYGFEWEYSQKQKMNH